MTPTKPANWDEYSAAVEDIHHFYGYRFGEIDAFIERTTGIRTLKEVPSTDPEVLQVVIDAVCERIPPKPGRTLACFDYETGCEVFPLESVLPALDRQGARLGMFNYGGVLVQILPNLLGKEIGALNQDAFAAKLGRWIRFQKAAKKGAHQTACPPKLINAIFGNAARLQSIALRRIALTPIYRNGVLHSGSGFYAEEHLFLDAPPVAIPARDRAAGEAARDYLVSWLEEFPFASPVARSVGLAVLLSAAMRASGLRCPGFLFSKPSYGAGASTLVDLAHILMTGRQAPVINAGKSAVEIDKEIDSAQGHGRPALALDNVPAGQLFNTTALAQTIQQDFRAARILGESRSPIVECSQLVTVTGVNVRLADDLVRRFVACSLDPKMEQPETKSFKRPQLLQEAQRDRAKILQACYTAIAAFEASGEVVPTRKIVGFDDWCSLIGGTLRWLGLPDPAGSQEEIRADDPVTADLHELLRVWLLLLGEKPVTAMDIIKAKSSPEVTGDCLDDAADIEAEQKSDPERAAAREELSELLDRIAEDRRGQVSSKTLGYWLKRHKKRVAGGWQLLPVEGARGHNNVGKWQLVKVEQNKPATPHQTQGKPGEAAHATAAEAPESNAKSGDMPSPAEPAPRPAPAGAAAAEPPVVKPNGAGNEHDTSFPFDEKPPPTPAATANSAHAPAPQEPTKAAPLSLRIECISVQHAKQLRSAVGRCWMRPINPRSFEILGLDEKRCNEIEALAKRHSASWQRVQQQGEAA